MIFSVLFAVILNNLVDIAKTVIVLIILFSNSFISSVTLSFVIHWILKIDISDFDGNGLFFLLISFSYFLLFLFKYLVNNNFSLYSILDNRFPDIIFNINSIYIPYDFFIILIIRKNVFINNIFVVLEINLFSFIVFSMILSIIEL